MFKKVNVMSMSWTKLGLKTGKREFELYSQAIILGYVSLYLTYKKEVSLIYHCRRTATVTANNYCTLAFLQQQNFKDLINKYPRLLVEMKEQIYAYDDDIKAFMTENLQKIGYLKNLELDIFHEVMFNFIQETFDKGDFLFKDQERSNTLFVVKNGILEIISKIEGFQLVIERLY